jgi:DNA-binding protein HU-beta
MNTADLIERLATEHGITKDQTRKILDSAFAAIAAAASAGEEVILTGFGRFKVIDRAERQGRNPIRARQSPSSPRRNFPLPRPKAFAMP